MYTGFGAATAPPPRKTEMRQSAYTDLPLASRNACKAATRAGQFPDIITCYEGLRAGAPVPIVDMPMTAEEAQTSRTTLYVGMAIAAVVVVGVGAYLITK